MNKQEIFDAVVTHHFAQKAKCAEDDLCMYRGPEGRKCFVGALISDEDYRPSMDDGSKPTGIEAMVSEYPHLPQWMRDEVEFLTKLQHVHDRNTDTGRFLTPWFERVAYDLWHVADEYGLSKSVLNENMAKYRATSLELV